ncbi:hypothetical protein FDG2_2407 [Candidatus Protofrankia californiensis]|uniref:AB hydrolase-1 domain-containing protein n=1 Tax=Candidatus Protofrankia californiensis TaxID=1839754 RepID=A0A1C3NXL0_9ACTN|nr:hypothetical protein FDG2_2407 [Candidatus Protofrankia californiensis]
MTTKRMSDMDTLGMHVTVAGSGVPLLFIHGYAVDHRTFLPCEDILAASGRWQRIYLDLPGFGASPSTGVEPTADALAVLVEEFVSRNIHGPFGLVGNSFGAQIARRLISVVGDRVVGVAFISPVVVGLESANLPERVYPRTNRELRGRLDPVDRSLFRANAVDQSWESWLRFERCVLPGLKAYDRRFGEALRGAFVPACADEFEKDRFDRPALLVTSRQDTVVGWLDQQRLLTDYSRLESVLLDSSGHNPHVDRPAMFEQCFREWLRRVEEQLD